MISARRMSVLLVAAGLLLAPVARAQPEPREPTPADSETALELFKEGKALRDKGDNAAALEKLRAAHALVETPLTALELGRTYATTGKLLEARDVLLGVARMPLRKNESTKATEARTEAAELAAQLRPRLASLTVRPKGASDGPPKVSVDGVVIPPDAATVPRLLNPGPHVVVVEANGQRAQSEVTLAEGQSQEVEIELPAPSAAPVAASPLGPAPPPRTEKKISPLVYAGFGTAIVGIGVGTATGIMTLSTASTLKDTCRSGQCPPASQSDLDSASTTGTVSTVAFVIGLAGVAMGVAGLVMTNAEPARTGLRIVPGPGGVSGTF
ncbi:MAG: hypothetical protein KF819_23345 [Labilithrix sp.]|nr:hypothetical protein [Labilithrix sp.]